MNVVFFIDIQLPGHLPIAELASVEGVVLRVAALVLLVLLNGLFVAAEFAIVKVRDSQLDSLIEGGKRSARLARRLATNPDAYLSATQLGITVSSLALGWLGEPFLSRLLQPLFHMAGVVSPGVVSVGSLLVAFALITFLHVVLGELAPKSLAVRKPVGTLMVVGHPVRLFHLFFRPLIWLMNLCSDLILRHVLRIDPLDQSEMAHSEEELRLIVSETQNSRSVSPVGREILMNALDMSRRVVRDIMTPRGRIVFLDLDDDFEENVRIARESRHTRFPLCRDHIDNTVGLVHIKDLLAALTEGKSDLQEIKRELLPVPEMMPLEKLLTFFLGRHAHLAIVVDEYGGTVGMVTLDNVLAEIVGDIQDEFDIEKPEFVRLNDDEFVVSGGLGLYELEEHVDLTLENAEVSTVGGYVVHLLGHLPKAGEEIGIGQYIATVTKTDGKSIGQLHFRYNPDAADDGGDENGNGD